MDEKMKKYIELVQSYAKANYRKCFRESGGKFAYPYFVPGSSYAYELWDWDSWLTDIALAEIAGAANAMQRVVAAIAAQSKTVFFFIIFLILKILHFL